MTRFIIIIGILLTLIGYYFYILSLMNLFPIWISVPFLISSIALTLSPLAAQKRFKGFR
ncbi:hypothetical protein [Halalkalibacter alkalisediminis]|uniref:Uncharacterized protein n=1 Tax=Halalkalibacter alkalisediminis TaxID=935616 RepID=A0ABV6NAA4_9BACI|nr:hypothetical protein [Halalkalibacter alkalisediminis]